MEQLRPRSAPQNRFLFGKQEVRTKVYMMVPRDVRPEYIDVVAALDGYVPSATTSLPILSDRDPMLANLYDGRDEG
jgi:hypothetical protein